MDYQTLLATTTTKKSYCIKVLKRKRKLYKTAIMLGIYQKCAQLLDFGFLTRGTAAVTEFFKNHPVRTVAAAVIWDQMRNVLMYSSFLKEYRSVGSYS